MTEIATAPNYKQLQLDAQLRKARASRFGRNEEEIVAADRDMQFAKLAGLLSEAPMDALTKAQRHALRHLIPA